MEIRKDKPLTAVFLLPHKSFEKIAKEYNIEFRKDDLLELADVFRNKGTWRRIYYLWNLGEKLGIEKEKRWSFIRDVYRVCVFYITAVKKMKELGILE